MTTWNPVIDLPSGHRVFAGGGRFAVADESGSWPHLTDDGVLWLDFDRPLTLGEEASEFVPRDRVMPMIPLKREDGTETRTVADAASIVALSLRFDWGINVRGTLLRAVRA
jgi:hypothetical protein